MAFFPIGKLLEKRNSSSTNSHATGKNGLHNGCAWVKLDFKIMSFTMQSLLPGRVNLSITFLNLDQQGLELVIMDKLKSDPK